MRARQVDRQFDQPEGRRGAFLDHAKKVRRYGAAVVVMAFDEQGQAETADAEIRDLQARLQASDREGRVSAGRHHLRSQHLRRRHRHRGAQQLRASPSSKPRAASRRSCLTCMSRAAFPTSPSPSAATSAVREAMHSVFLYHAIQAGHGHGHRQCRPARALRRYRPRAARACRRRNPQPPRRRDRPPARSCRAIRGAGGRRSARSISPGARSRSRSASLTRWCTASAPISMKTPKRRGRRPRARCM